MTSPHAYFGEGEHLDFSGKTMFKRIFREVAVRIDHQVINEIRLAAVDDLVKFIPLLRHNIPQLPAGPDDLDVGPGFAHHWDHFFGKFKHSIDGERLTIFARTAAVIVIADDAVISAEYAAKELAHYIKKATGAVLPIVREKALKKGSAAIYVGNTAAARNAGLTQDKFPKESFTIQEKDGNLYIVGGEDKQKLFYVPDDAVNLKTSLLAGRSNGIVRLTRRCQKRSVDTFPFGLHQSQPGCRRSAQKA